MDSSLVHYGCGLCAPPTWRNFDSSPTLRLQRIPAIGRRVRVPGHPVFPRNIEYGDIVRGLPVQPGSARAIFCSHVLEHLALEDFRTALRNTLSYLRPGGVFRLVVPDLEVMARAYVDSADPGAALAFMQTSLLGHATRPRGAADVARSLFGAAHHLWMWDHKGMEAELRAAGFREVRRARFGDAEVPEFADVEEAGRFTLAVAMQCIR